MLYLNPKRRELFVLGVFMHLVQYKVSVIDMCIKYETSSVGSVGYLM
jgi:hypothetical protein